MARSSKLSNNKKRKLQHLVAQATKAYQSQRYDMCENLCKRIEVMHPNDADVAAMRGGMSLAAYGVDVALPYFIQAVEAAAKRIDFRINLGRLYLQARHYGPAYKQYEQAVRLDGREILAVLGCCRSLLGLGRHEEAEQYFQQACRLRLEQPDDYVMLAAASRDLDHVEKALSTLRELLSRYPDYTPGHFEKALTALQTGDKSEAKTALDRVLQLDPFHARALSLLPDLHQFISADDARVQLIREAYEQSAPDSDERVQLNVAMGRVMQRLGNYDASFEYFRQGNEIRISKSEYKHEDALSQMDAMGRYFTPDVFGSASDLEDDTPVFIVGMPRCGSSLTEQILVAHPEASGRGEIDLFEPALSVINDLDAPPSAEDMVRSSSECWARVGQLYLDRLRASGADASRITDKSLNNIRLIGAIHCALPRARIIHVRRNPLDTCISIFTSHIQGGVYDYGLKLETLGEYYLKYLELMQHWREVLPEGVMYELEYEQLVSHQEEETRKLLAFCGLAWDEHCMQFQKAEHRVKTASIMQVRQAINTKSVERWRRYEKHLQPLIDILGTG